MKILVTGGTVFVSKAIASYFVSKNEEVYVLNRNTRKQVEGVHLIQADRHHLQDKLKDRYFDVIIDVSAYTKEDIMSLLDSQVKFNQYIFISSSAVYPEYNPLPFKEDDPLGENKYWKSYGTCKIEAEQALLERVKDAYIIRPPYLYGPGNNVYREAFVFDCALLEKPFYLPKQGQMKLQFFHIDDLCLFIELLIKNKPNHSIYNVGNKELVTIKEWVELCYHVVGKEVDYRFVEKEIDQRNYFSFYDYEYYLDVSLQEELLEKTKDIKEGLLESYLWYKDHQEDVKKKAYLEYIEKEFND